MTVENPTNPESSLIRFTEALIKLSDRENPQPINPINIDVQSIKVELQTHGIQIETIKNNPELVKSVSESQFRGPDQGKGPAVVVAVGGIDNYQKLSQWAMEISKDQPQLSSGDESSKCRGMMQFFGETIALAAGAITPADYCDKTNLRVGKKFQKNPIISQRFNLPTDEKGIKKLKETSSIPKGSATKAWEKLLFLNQ